MRRRVVLVLLATLLIGAGVPGSVGAAHDDNDRCKAHPPGGHDPRARVEFAATLKGQAEIARGRQFDFGTIRHLYIDVRWERFRLPGRQRLELYTPAGDLYQTFTNDLGRRPDNVVLTVPVAGTQIYLNTLAGTWCARIFLDDDLEPVAAESFELTFSPGN